MRAPFVSGPDCRSQNGVALIAVLLLLVFILSVVGGLFYRHQIHLQKVSSSLVREQALLLAMSAESWVKQQLENDARNTAVDSLDELWARELPAMPVEGGTVSGCLLDMQARFNINLLGWYTNKSWELELQQEGDELTTRRRWMQRIMQVSGVDAGDIRIASLVDFLDGDNWLTIAESAEDNEYLALTPARRSANQLMLELQELSLVMDYSSADVSALGWGVTALPAETGLNVNTADVVLLETLSPLISGNAAAAIIERRPFESVGDFYRQLATVAGYPEQRLRSAIPESFVSVSSDYFQLYLRVDLAGIHMKYRALYRRGAPEVEVMMRTFEAWPEFEQTRADRATTCRAMALMEN